MARYDVECQSCRHVEEIVLSVHDSDVPGCPACGGPRKKLIVGVSVKTTMPIERSERYKHWYETKGKKRMKLPDDHPKYLEPVSKSDDVRHM